MGEGGCAKFFLVAINIVFMLFGAAFLIAGGVFIAKFSVIRDALVDNSGTDFNLKYAGDVFGYAVIGIGAVILLIAILGCLGACCENRVLLGIYGALVAVILIVEIAVVGVVAASAKSDQDWVTDGLKKVLTHYEDNGNKKRTQDKAFDAIFSTFQCCGVNNYTDFQDLQVDWDPRNTDEVIPIACCQNVDYANIKDQDIAKIKPCLSDPTTSNAYIQGCYSKLIDFVNNFKYVAIGVGVAVFVIELLLCICAFCMCCRGDKDGYMA